MYKSVSLLFIFSLLNLTTIQAMQQLVQQTDPTKHCGLKALFSDPNCYFRALKDIPARGPSDESTGSY